ncbi:MAG: NAD(P)H-hydrate dehydratase [Chitinophagales bacterium]|nr:NAD(P)H-hydrate dehydratase [Chitinophagales bacterium]
MIRILSSEQIREADRYSIEHIPIRSLDLMELAAMAFTQSFVQHYSADQPVVIFCGNGNNGGDGLAIARILLKKNYSVSVFILAGNKSYSEDFLANKAWLEKISADIINTIDENVDFPAIPDHIVIVDAIFGSGLNRALSGIAEKLITYLNQQKAIRVSVDIPSGLFADRVREGVVFNADHTITFQQPKLAFFFPENNDAVGKWEVVPIGLDQQFIQSLPVSHFLLEKSDLQSILKPRRQFDHKGTFGHALIHAGSHGKMGAAILCATACIRCGAGLTTLHIPEAGIIAANTAIPEAMTIGYDKKGKSEFNQGEFSSIAFGPGIGTNESTSFLLLRLLKKSMSPAVFDADALNIIAAEKKSWQLIPKDSIITPHLKEFERLAGTTNNWLERHRLQVTMSRTHSIYIVLKGAATCITTPDGLSFFNATGNPGMAKGGSGDVLTGIIAGLLAQHYPPMNACLLGVYLHGLAADIAVKKQSVYSLLASDIIATIGDAYRELNPV